MPCYDAQAAEERREAPIKINRLTRLLCEACKALVRAQGEAGMSTELRTWWHDHLRNEGHIE